MIRYLTIRDLAVIGHLELTLEPGLNILSGETGTGKSIVVGALGRDSKLVPAPLQAVRTSERTMICVISEV